MKKHLLAAVIGTTLALPLIAQAEGSYFGANIGRTEQKLSIDGGGSIKDDVTAFKLYGGASINKNFGVELGYVNFGKFEKSETDSTGTVSISSKPQAIYFAGTGTLPLNPQFSLFGKVGISANRTKVSASVNGSSVSNTESGASLMLGVGAAYDLTSKASLVVEYENFGKVYKENGLDVKADLLSVGLRYKF